MAKLENLIYLVHSLSASEKRNFRVYTKMQEGKKEYVELFNILDEGFSAQAEIKAMFKKRCNIHSFEMSSKHLYKVLIKTLLIYEHELDIESIILNNIREIKLLFSKRIYEECFKLIKKTKELAEEKQQFSLLSIVLRIELQYMERLELPNITENNLIEKHNKIDLLLKYQKNILEHSYLNELLRYRYLSKGEVRSKNEQEKLNDLVFAEMQLVSKPHYDSFEAKKLHLLFQSVYFSMTGNLKSSLKTYYELDELFEINKRLWSDPPIYYIEHLQGILYNLRSLKYYKDMQYFLDKLMLVKTGSVQSQLRILQIIYQFRISSLLDTERFNEALNVKEEYEDSLIKKSKLLPPNSRAKVYLYTAMIYLALKDYKKSSRLLNEILNEVKEYKQLPVYHTIRLISLIVHFDQYKFDYIEYEIRAFQRQIAKRENVFQTEKLIFSFMKKYMNTLSKSKQELLIKETILVLEKLKDDKYERQLFSEFDFVKWLKNAD